MWSLVVLAPNDTAIADADDPDGAFSQPLTLAQLERAFAYFDVMGDGVLQPYDLTTGLAELGLKSKRGLLEQTIRAGMGDGAFDVDHPLSFKQFCTAYHTGFLAVKEAFRQDMMDVFAFFDASGDGLLESAELYQTFCAVCPFSISEERFTEIFAKLDGNADGQINANEFVDGLLHSQLSLTSAANLKRAASSGLGLAVAVSSPGRAE